MWKRLFFKWVYRPFNQFCRFRLKIPSFNGETCGCGAKRLIWTDHQGVVDYEWQAIQACETHGPRWGYHMLPHNGLLPEETTVECVGHNYPLADERLQTKLRRNGKPTIEVPALDMVRLASKVESSNALVEQFKSSS